MRGRLIFPFGIEIRRLDTAAITDSPGYDPTFREPKLESTRDGLGRVGRKEMDPIILPGQFTSKSEFMQLQMTNNGDLGESKYTVLFHFRDIENAGLIEADTGLALIRVGDRMSAIYAWDVDGTPGALVQKIPNPPGLFVTGTDPRYGLGRSRTLLPVTFVSRDQGMPLSAGYIRV